MLHGHATRPASGEPGEQDRARGVHVGQAWIPRGLDAVKGLIHCQSAHPHLTGVGDEHGVGAQVGVGHAGFLGGRQATCDFECEGRGLLGRQRFAASRPQVVTEGGARDPLGHDDEQTEVGIVDDVEDGHGAAVGHAGGIHCGRAQSSRDVGLERGESDADRAAQALVVGAPHRGAGDIPDAVDEAVASEQHVVGAGLCTRSRLRRAGHGARVGTDQPVSHDW